MYIYMHIHTWLDMEVENIYIYIYIYFNFHVQPSPSFPIKKSGHVLISENPQVVLLCKLSKVNVLIISLASADFT